MVKLYSVNWIQDYNFCARINTEMKVNEFMRTYRQCFFSVSNRDLAKKMSSEVWTFFDSRPINPILTEIKTILAKDKESFHVHNIIKITDGSLSDHSYYLS